MSLFFPAQLKNCYDVIIVGSGADGEQTAYTITLEGMKVLLLEAGRKDLRYVGNMSLASFDGPPPEVLRQAGLDPQE